jgi:hypothetical protein
MNTTNYGTEIVNNFEKQGESKDFIIGFLKATLNQLIHVENDKVLEYMKRTVEQSKKA